MAGHWYSRKSEHALYEQPRATTRQIKHARSLLAQTGAISLDDYDGHVGALTLLRDHLRKAAADPPDRSELKHRFRVIAKRPGFSIRDPWCSRPPRSHWAWIDSRSIALSGTVGKPFPSSEYSPSWMADLAQEILANFDVPDLYARHLGHPRHRYVIVVSSFPGPLGPVRPIGTNGNHRSMAFAALKTPLVLAEVHDIRPPYSITYNEEDDDWGITRDFLRWQQDRGALRFSPIPLCDRAATLTYGSQTR